MARTRGGCSQGEGRERPTTSVCKGGGDDVPVNIPEAEAFPGGPIDGSLLLSYCDHVAYKLWEGEVSIYDLQFLFEFWFGWLKILMLWFRITKS